jgi:hypothetical protein
MKGFGLLSLLITAVIGLYLTTQNMKAVDTPQTQAITDGDLQAQSRLQDALHATQGVVVDGETTTFTSADLVKTEASFTPATGAETGGPSADPSAVSVQYNAGTLTLCNASKSGNAFCLRSRAGAKSFSQAVGSVSAAQAAPFGPAWVASAKPTADVTGASGTNAPAAAPVDPAQAARDAVQGVNGLPAMP